MGESSDVQTKPMTLLLYYSFDACIESVEMLNTRETMTAEFL